MSLIKNYLHTQMTETTDNIIDRDALQQNLIDRIVDDMDLKTLMQLVAEQLDHNYDDYTVDQLIACLLYTSPSPRDLYQSRMPSSA